jgi:hypothetical protein
MTIVKKQQKQEPEASNKQKYSSTNNRVFPTLINKEQLNTIVTNKDGSPDYLAINIYYDTFRSWYNPKTGYNKDGNVYHINKLKTPGIFLNYTRLSEIHGCSKETVRKKIVKLELLGLVHRSFQHKETSTTKSYNGLIAYVWKDTPHFYNPMGVDSNQVSRLTAQTNHEYIERRYGISFGSLALQNKGISTGGGIQLRLDTKELNNIIFKDIRSNVHAHESNFLQNSKEVKITGNVKAEVSTFPHPPAKPVKLKKRVSNQRKKTTNTERKARIYHFNQYKESQPLSHHYPLTKEDGDKLQSLSRRDFSLQAMNEILLGMSKRLSNTFLSKAQFMAYFGKVLRYEKRDAIKTNNVNFHIKANHTQEKQAEIDQKKRVEKYLAELEQRAIDNVCPENQLKARLANTLEVKSSYELLSTIKDFKVVGNTMRIYLRSTVELNEHEKEVVLSQVRSIYSNSELDIESVEYVVENVRNFTNNHNNLQTKKAVDLPLLQQSAWGDVCRQLIKTYGIHIYNHWFSKLTPVIDEDAKTIELIVSNSFVQEEVTRRYGDNIKKIVNELGMKFKGISK